MIDAHSGDVLAGPDVVNRGFVFDEGSGHILDEARHRTRLALKESAAQHVVDPGVLKQQIRSLLVRVGFEPFG